MTSVRMDRGYWDRLASTYDQEVLSSFDADLSGIIARRLDELAGVKKTALDLGCGVGKYIGALSERFGHVVAADHSDELLKIARRDHANRGNLDIRLLDATQKGSFSAARADVVVCANVLIMADDELRAAILETARKCMAPRGRLVLVVPSLESALLAHRRLVQWYDRDGSKDAETDAEDDARAPSKRTSRELLRGVMRIDGVPTKHYLAEELSLMLQGSRLQIEHLDKVPYAWDSEFGDAPRWMRAPYPWDWLVVAKRLPRRR